MTTVWLALVCGLSSPQSGSAPAARRIIESARDQLGWGTRYDPGYYRIAYPMGDVPREIGVCTDVVVRSLRRAGYDLQRLIHEDMQVAWRRYPRYPGSPHPDSNIDQRRVPNLRVFFTRHGRSLPVGIKRPNGWLPGDTITWKLENGRDHIGVLTDRRNPTGFPLIIHNIGYGPQEEDVLRNPHWTITGHYRFPR